MRPRTRDAVSVFVRQSGSMIFVTAPVSTAPTGVSPIAGRT